MAPRAVPGRRSRRPVLRAAAAARPPRLPQLLLRLLLPWPEIREGVLGDLQEEHATLASQSSRTHSLAYWRSAFSLGAAFVVERLRVGLRRLRGRETSPRLPGIPAPQRGDPLMDRVAHDLRHTIRCLIKQPAFTAVVILTLSLGIGATTAIFTLVDAILLSPLPFDDQHRIVTVSHTAPALGLDNAGQCAAWHFTYEAEASVFEDLGLFSGGTATVIGAGEPEVVPALYSTSGLFRALRLTPVLGRSMTVADEAVGAPNGLLLGFDYWHSRFGADPEIIGQSLDVNGTSWEIVGVLPRSLRSLGAEIALVFPIRLDQSTLYVGNIGLGGIGRLRDGVTLEQAHADLERVLPHAWERYPGGPVASSNEPSQYSPRLRLLKEDMVGSAADLLWLLLAGVAAVLLIACANVANLFLVRSEGRDTEMAVRIAIGASHARIRWEYLRESLLLGLLGGVGGLGLAQFGLRLLVSGSASGLPRLEAVTISPTVLLFTLLVSLAAGSFFGLFPAPRQSRRNPVDTLKQGGTSATDHHDRRRAQDMLAVSQMALALVLLVASALTLRSFFHLRSVDPGFADPGQVLAFRLFIPSSQISDIEETADAFDRIGRRLADIPGVDAVGLANGIPMDGSGNVNPFYVDGVEWSGDGPVPMRAHKWIGAGYFEAMRIPILAGRTFTAAEVESRFAGALLSEGLAREYFGSPAAALGRRIAARPEPVRWHEVIGVVPDVRERGMDQEALPVVYWPQVTLGFWQGDPIDAVQTWRSMAFAVRSDRVGTTGLLEQVRDAVWSVNSDLPLRGLQPLPGLMARSMARASFTLVLLGAAAAAALTLGIVGVYGVISYGVTQRSRELAMRIALGAQARQVQRMVLRRGLALAGVGALIGLGLAIVLTRLMATQLHGIDALDPVTYSVVPLALLAVALLASYLPARRAAHVDPMTALRES